MTNKEQGELRGRFYRKIYTQASAKFIAVLFGFLNLYDYQK